MLPLRSFHAFIEQNNLFNTSHKVLLAVSGGKDSVLMAHLFKQAGFTFGIAHCNFSLRAGESLRDEAFVKSLAESLDVPFHCETFNTRSYAKAKRLSTQMAARELRYNWFEELRLAEQYDFVALAQHQNDAIETVLLNLTRGTGISGLHGILPKRGTLIRPLLFLSASDIQTIVETNKISYVEDSSNSSDYYARNKIRLHVVPQLKAINPNLEHTFAQNIQRFSDTEVLVQQSVERYRASLIKPVRNGFSLSIELLKQLHPQHFLLYELLKPFGFTATLVADLIAALDKQSGTSFFSSSHRITINRDVLLISENNDAAGTILAIEAEDRQILFQQQQLIISEASGSGFERDKNKAFVDADLLIYPLQLRSWQQGDTFKPLGMKTFKKLSNFLIDEKVPLPDKASVPLLINGNGEVIWLAGLRADDRYKVRSTTKKVIIFELKSKNES
jgi:tRNA(Ile)-lysidine synthase